MRYPWTVPIPADKAVSEFIASRLRTLFPTSRAKKKLPGQFSLQHIADELGVTKPQVSDALASGKGIGRKFEERFAERYFNGSIDQLRVAAVAWAAEQPDPIQPRVERDDLSPHAAEAMKAFTWDGVPAPEYDRVRAALVGQHAADGIDRFPSWWTSEIRRLLRETRATAKSVHQREPATVVDLDGPSPEFLEMKRRRAEAKAAKSKGKKR